MRLLPVPAPAGSCFLIGGQLLLLVAFAATGFGSAAGGFSVWNALTALALALLIAGLAGLGGSGLLGGGELATIGLAVAMGGAGTSLIGHVLLSSAAGRDDATTFASGGLGLAVGMAMAGTAGLRARRWPGWSRFLPLACGLYPVVVGVPLGVLGHPRPALAGFGVLWALLGVAVHRTRPIAADSEPDQPGEVATHSCTASAVSSSAEAA